MILRDDQLDRTDWDCKKEYCKVTVFVLHMNWLGISHDQEKIRPFIFNDSEKKTGLAGLI